MSFTQNKLFGNQGSQNRLAAAERAAPSGTLATSKSAQITPYTTN